MAVNVNIIPRALTPEELEARRRGEYDSFANYLVFCPRCGHMVKTNMYVMRAEAYIDELGDTPCPDRALPMVIPAKQYHRKRKIATTLSPRGGHICPHKLRNLSVPYSLFRRRISCATCGFCLPYDSVS